MNNLTNEQIRAILDGAPDGATHFDGDYLKLEDILWFNYCQRTGWYKVEDDDFGLIEPAHKLSDLAELLALRERVERLEQELEVWRPVVEQQLKE